VATDRSTILGWHWGENAAAPVQLDSAGAGQPSAVMQLSSATKTNLDSGDLLKLQWHSRKRRALSLSSHLPIPKGD